MKPETFGRNASRSIIFVPGPLYCCSLFSGTVDVSTNPSSNSARYDTLPLLESCGVPSLQSRAGRILFPFERAGEMIRGSVMSTPVPLAVEPGGKDVPTTRSDSASCPSYTCSSSGFQGIAWGSRGMRHSRGVLRKPWSNRCRGAVGSDPEPEGCPPHPPLIKSFTAAISRPRPMRSSRRGTVGEGQRRAGGNRTGKSGRMVTVRRVAPRA